MANHTYSATMLADSANPQGVRLTTMEVTFPRIVLAEFNTHRMFSRNSASSRAIPVEKQLEMVQDHPFVPEYWGENQSGMQAEKELSQKKREYAEKEWLEARDNAMDQALRLYELGVHKQLTNRLLEPFMWHTVIVTATEWENFFALRANRDAQPEIREIAMLMKDIYKAHTPERVGYSGWHLPLVKEDDHYELRTNSSKESILAKISAARCARVSYLTHDGKRDIGKDLALYKRLVDHGHMSPLEHVARPYLDQYGIDKDLGNFKGWLQLRKLIPHENNFANAKKLD